MRSCGQASKEDKSREGQPSDVGYTAAQPHRNPVYQPHRLVARQHMGWNLRPNYRMLEMVGHGSYGEVSVGVLGSCCREPPAIRLRACQVMAAVDVTSNRKVCGA
jgi:hypothetical protein